jgi:hypothetical protein
MMKFRKGRTATAFVVAALVAISALGVSNAFAAHSPHWVVGSSNPFTGSATLTASNTTAFTLEVPKFVTISCTTVSGTGEIKEEYKDSSSGGISFSGCTVPSAAVCTVRSPGQSVGTINTEPVATELEAISSAPYDKFTPAAGSTANFVEIEVLGTECSAKGTFPVTGSVAGKQVGTVPATTIHMEFAKANTGSQHLKFGTKEAFLGGTAAFTLTGTHAGESWEASL